MGGTESETNQEALWKERCQIDLSEDMRVLLVLRYIGVQKMDNTVTVSCTLCANNLKLYVKEFLFVIFIICVCACAPHSRKQTSCAS